MESIFSGPQGPHRGGASSNKAGARFGHSVAAAVRVLPPLPAAAAFAIPTNRCFPAVSTGVRIGAREQRSAVPERSDDGTQRPL